MHNYANQVFYVQHRLSRPECVTVSNFSAVIFDKKMHIFYFNETYSYLCAESLNIYVYLFSNDIIEREYLLPKSFSLIWFK